MTFKPLHSRVLVERLNPDEVTEGGIIIPDTSQKKREEGKVIEVGEVKSVKRNDIVIFNSGKEIIINDKEYVLVDEEDILGKVEK